MVWWDLSDHRVKREFRKKIIKEYGFLGKGGVHHQAVYKSMYLRNRWIRENSLEINNKQVTYNASFVNGTH